MINYLNLKYGAPTRMRILKNMSSDWKAARRCGYHNVASYTGMLNKGMNGKREVYYSHSHDVFGDKTRYADKVHSRITHIGWFCDTDQSNIARGIVVKLSHGRYIAGYELSDFGGRTYFADHVFDDEIECATMADREAESIAESEREYSENWNAAQTLESNIDDAKTRLIELLVLRHSKCLNYVRDEISEVIENIRTMRERMETEFKGVL